MADEMWLQCVREDLEELGCDEEFIEVSLEELRDGGEIIIGTPKGTARFVATASRVDESEEG